MKPHPLRILVVDDHTLNLQLAESLLLQMGHHCLLARNGEQALAVLASEPVDLVLMDVAMPVMDGMRALQMIRRRPDMPRQIPVLMVTAHVQPHAQRLYERIGANGCIAKPVTLEKLQEQLMTYASMSTVQP